MSRRPLSGQAFTAFGWFVCIWVLVLAFQVSTSYCHLTAELTSVVVWLSYIRPQPDTSRAYMQRQGFTLRSLRPVDMHTHVRIYFFCRYSRLHRWGAHR